MITKFLTCVTALLVALAPSAFAQDGTAVSTLDQDFLVAAQQANNAEIALSQLALTNSTNARVLRYAERMVAEHSTVASELATVAGSVGVVSALGTDPAHTTISAALSTETGSDFNRDYLRQMVVDHQMSINLFRAITEVGTNTQVTQYALSKLPALRDHLREALNIQSALGFRKNEFETGCVRGDDNGDDNNVAKPTPRPTVRPTPSPLRPTPAPTVSRTPTPITDDENGVNGGIEVPEDTDTIADEVTDEGTVAAPVDAGTVN